MIWYEFALDRPFADPYAQEETIEEQVIWNEGLRVGADHSLRSLQV